jgi:hypothetical protein
MHLYFPIVFSHAENKEKQNIIRNNSFKDFIFSILISVSRQLAYNVLQLLAVFCYVKLRI